MGRPLHRQLLLAALIVTATACSDNGATTITSPAPPTSGGITEAFPGTLALNGAQSFSFTATTSGSITAKLTTLAPNTPVGVWLGVWDGARCAFGAGREDATQYDPS